MSRGNDRRNIVRDGADRERRLHWLQETVDTQGRHAFVLMTMDLATIQALTPYRTDPLPRCARVRRDDHTRSPAQPRYGNHRPAPALPHHDGFSPAYGCRRTPIALFQASLTSLSSVCTPVFLICPIRRCQNSPAQRIRATHRLCRASRVGAHPGTSPERSTPAPGQQRTPFDVFPIDAEIHHLILEGEYPCKCASRPKRMILSLSPVALAYFAMLFPARTGRIHDAVRLVRTVVHVE